MLRVGDEIQRHDGRRFRLVGVQGGAWVATALDCHAPPVTLSARELVTGFGVDDPSVSVADEGAIMAARDREATTAARMAYGRHNGPREGNQAQTTTAPPGSPEAVFAALQDDAG